MLSITTAFINSQRLKAFFFGLLKIVWVHLCICMELMLFIYIKLMWEMCIHFVFVCVTWVIEMFVCMDVQFVSYSDSFSQRFLQWIGAEIGQNHSHFPPQLLPPLLLLSFLAQQTWKLPPGQETLPQHPSKMQADGGTDGNRTSEQ